MFHKTRKFVVAIAVAAVSTGAASAAESEWTPPQDSWHEAAVAKIWTTFGEQSFDQIFWADASALRIVRHSYGENQNLLAITVCKSIAQIGPPAGEQISLKFYDTEAYAKGEIDEHASVTCG